MVMHLLFHVRDVIRTSKGEIAEQKKPLLLMMKPVTYYL